MLEYEGSDQRVPHRAYRMVVAAVIATGLKQLHQRFIREGVEDQLQALEITHWTTLSPAEKERMWNSRLRRFSC